MKRRKKSVSRKFINSLCEIFYSKKAENVKVIDTSSKTREFDYMVIVTATGKYHIDAIVEELEKFIEDNGLTVLGKDDNSETGWVVFDLVHTIVHIMTPEVREYYSLERIWEAPI